MSCKKISNNIEFNCDFPLIGGTRNKAYIINKEDIVDVVYNALNNMIVEEIVLKVGAIAYFVDGRNNSIMPSTSLIKGIYTDTFDHVVRMIGFDISPQQKLNMQGSVSGLYVVITENVYKGENGDSAFEIYGLNSGLEFTILLRDPNNSDTQGAYDFTLATNKNKEPYLPRNIFIVSYEATDVYIETLLGFQPLVDFNNDFNNDFN